MADQDPQQPTPASELATFGDELRREREIRGISLKEIADATKISKRFLEAIERNDHKTLPAPVFTRGFVREYARYLGLNAEEMVNRYNYAAAGDERVEKSLHLERLTNPQPPPKPPKPVTIRGIPRPYARIDRNLIVTFVLLVAVAGVAVWAVRYRKEGASHVDGAEVNASAVSHTAAAVTPAVQATTTQPKPAEASAAATLRLRVEAIANTWIVLEADDKPVYSDEMLKGATKTFEAKEQFRFKTIGNAAGLALTLNDVRIPSLGPEGKVRKDVIFDREYLQHAAEPAPAP